MPATVQMVPADHPYCRHIMPQDGPQDLTLLPDPPVPGAGPGQWWPPRALDAAWLRDQQPDVLHVHFGFDSFTPDELRDAVRALEAAGTALVLTVHDLHNPHFTDRQRHLDQLDVLVPAALEIVTLTPGAAAEILQRWQRHATVLPHPHIVPLDRLPGDARRDSSPLQAGQEVVIGLHAKDLRANVDPFAPLPGLAEAVRRLAARGVRATVRVDVRENPQDPAALPRLRAACTEHGFTLWEHGRLEDEALYADLLSLDVTVLPYAFGTHSGWLEMCRDLGVPLAVPTVGYFADQATSAGLATFTPGDDAALADAVLALLERRQQIQPESREARRAQRQWIAAEHGRLYARALALARARSRMAVAP